MIDFYSIYSKTGLDKEEDYSAPIRSLKIDWRICDLDPILHIIKKHPYYAFQYARDIIKGRWPEAESIIKTDAQIAYYYSKEIIQERWLEAEPLIMEDPFWSGVYCRQVVFE